MRPFVLTDLDDSLFQTLRKCPTGGDPQDLTPIAFAPDGAPSGFATPRQKAFLDWLTQTAQIIPVTARTRAALSRVRIPFTMAIFAHGGVILDDDGETHAEWSAVVRRQAGLLEGERDDLLADLTRVAAASGEPLTIAEEREDGVLFYIEARHDRSDPHAVLSVLGHLPLPTGWRRWPAGGRMTFLPPYIGKERAVDFMIPRLRARAPGVPILGLGDSPSDAPFLRLCDLLMTPPQSELAAAWDVFAQ